MAPNRNTSPTSLSASSYQLQYFLLWLYTSCLYTLHFTLFLKRVQRYYFFLTYANKFRLSAEKVPHNRFSFDYADLPYCLIASSQRLSTNVFLSVFTRLSHIHGNAARREKGMSFKRNQREQCSNTFFYCIYRWYVTISKVW